MPTKRCDAPAAAVLDHFHNGCRRSAAGLAGVVGVGVGPGADNAERLPRGVARPQRRAGELDHAWVARQRRPDRPVAGVTPRKGVALVTVTSSLAAAAAPAWVARRPRGRRGVR